MRLIKMFGLAAITMVAAMAFVGASSATAMPTQLCNNHDGALDECSSPTTSLHAVATNPLLEPSFGSHVTCSSSLAQANVGKLASPQVVNLTSLTWSGCVQSGEPCEVTTKKLGTGLVLKLSLTEAEVEFHNTEVLVECEASGLHCVYGGLPVLDATPSSGGQKATLHANVSLTKVSGFFCPSSAVWNALYVSLADVYFKS